MKLIKMPTNVKDKAVKDFDKAVAEARNKLLASDRITQSFKFEFEPPKDLTVPENIKTTLSRPRIAMSAETYLKMLQYVIRIDIECAWQGFVTRHPNNTFIISDVKMYPHKGSAAYVESDDTKLYKQKIITAGIEMEYSEIEKYEAWKLGLTVEQELSLRFQAHSHVNMGTTPSGTDLADQKKHMNDLINYLETHPTPTPEQLESVNPFYIFAIMNKRQDINWFLFDYSTGVLFEKEDIDFVVVWKDDFTMETLVEEINKNHSTKTYQNTYNNVYEPDFRYNFSRDRDIFHNDTFQGSTYSTNTDKIWEIKCTSELAHAEWIESEFYKKHKDLLFAHKDANVTYYFYYAMDDAAAKKIPFEKFRKDPFYTKCQGLILMEITRPKWYPPEIKKNKKNEVRKDKLADKINTWVLKDETPYILVDLKKEKFKEIDKKYKEVMEIIGEFVTITFRNKEKKLCFCILNPNFIEDDHLDCILALQDAGFALRSIEFEGEPESQITVVGD